MSVSPSTPATLSELLICATFSIASWLMTSHCIEALSPETFVVLGAGLGTGVGWVQRGSKTLRVYIVIGKTELKLYITALVSLFLSNFLL